MTSDQLQEELGALLGRCVKVIRELETENAELKARREWNGLTEPEMHELDWPSSGKWSYEDVRAFYLAVEAALREKNGG